MAIFNLYLYSFFYPILEIKIKVEDMEEEIKFLQEELTHGNVHYPNNITMKNYLDYLLVPSLVYWMEYPRTKR